ncbi:MAG TPA: sigma-70 family RNA polymerase sigma factor [Bacteroidales bacterium]|jgi:RNA polymerase sigma factor (sigma-70 family)|nr:sigma-70 family RNA polymerase sigma factor [Bacteroidales bacterium]HPT09132.1 sigma-70 family RNA polymerase sigma factor [Bacteroidales bacterium]
MMVRYSDDAILKGLYHKKSRYIEYFYKEYFPVIRSLVEKNSGTKSDVEDVFQDALLVLYKKCQNHDFKLTCSLKTYFYSISRNIWFQRLDRRWRLCYQSDPEVNEKFVSYGGETVDANESDLARQRLFQEHFFRLPADCQRILRLFFSKTPMSEIAESIHSSSVKYVKTRKYLCKNMLRKRILNDPACRPYIYQQGRQDNVSTGASIHVGGAKQPGLVKEITLK